MYPLLLRFIVEAERHTKLAIELRLRNDAGHENELSDERGHRLGRARHDLRYRAAEPPGVPVITPKR